jgi:hypothetical protein
MAMPPCAHSPLSPVYCAQNFDLQMRAGTQTLIQALQAIPWGEDVDNEDETLHKSAEQIVHATSDSDEDAQQRACWFFPGSTCVD